MCQIHTFPVLHGLLIQLQHCVELLQTGLFSWATCGGKGCVGVSHLLDMELNVLGQGMPWGEGTPM